MQSKLRFSSWVFLFIFFYTHLNGQIITTYAGIGTGASSGDGGPATAAHIPNPTNGNFDSLGNYYFAESFSAPRVRKISSLGIISTVAGNGVSGFGGDNGPATSAKFSFPSIFVDPSGNVFIADRDSHRVRKVDASTGIISTIAGNGLGGFSGDGGPATDATIYPFGLCVDSSKNIYVIDSGVRVRKISAGGEITTIAGNGLGGFSGDGGQATNAQLTINYSLALDHAATNLYIDGQTRIRKVNLSTGIISTVAGNGYAAYTGDEIPATDAQIGSFGIFVDPNDNLFISDYINARVRKIDMLGSIHTVVGMGAAGFGGDNGPATSAQIYYPEGVVLDNCGNLYVADGNNNRIRKVTYPPILTTPTISLNSSTSSAPLGSSVTINATVSNAGSSYIIHWLNRGVEFTTTTVPSVTYTKAAGTDTITARVVSTATYGCYDSTTSSGWVVTASAMETSGLAERAEVLRIWPTPTKDVLHIDNVSVVSSYRVISMVGAMLLRGELKAGSNAIDVRDLPAGMYMVEITGNDGKRTVKKIIRQ